jgi:hypothetical protein
MKFAKLSRKEEIKLIEHLPMTHQKIREHTTQSPVFKIAIPSL